MPLVPLLGNLAIRPTREIVALILIARAVVKHFDIGVKMCGRSGIARVELLAWRAARTHRSAPPQAGAAEPDHLVGQVATGISRRDRS
jgi:hypothetical protein